MSKVVDGDTYISNVESRFIAPGEAVDATFVAAVKDFMVTTLCCANSTIALGTQRSDIDESKDPFKSMTLPHRRATRRVIDQLVIDNDAATSARSVLATSESTVTARTLAAVPGVAHFPEAEHNETMELLGHESNALAVARLLGGSAKVDVQDKLLKAGLPRLPHPCQVDRKVFQILHADAEAAKLEDPARLPFTYLNLPAARMLPGWLPEDSTSGRGHDDEVYTGLDPVSRLGSAMEKATGKRRFFRRTSQWTITMLRVGAALVGCGQTSQIRSRPRWTPPKRPLRRGRTCRRMRSSWHANSRSWASA